MNKKKNILIIDDSALMRRLISDIIEADDRFHIIGTATDGLDGLSLLQWHAGMVDAIILDINMPRMNGIEFLEELQKQNIKTAVVVVSSVTTKEARETIRALELGAFDFITKPEKLDDFKNDVFSESLIKCLALATKINLTEPQPKTEDTGKRTVIPVRRNRTAVAGNKLIAIACSTGGPKALHTIIPKLPQHINAGIVIVQHMPEGFTKSLAERLNNLSQILVKEAEDGDVIRKGWAYVARGGRQLRIVKDRNGNHLIRLYEEPARHGLNPCADIMYESLTETDYDEILCVVLTGMGSDGTAGISELKKKKNIHVIAQDSKSSIVYGMPKMVIEAGLADEIVSLDDVADAIIKNVGD